MITPIDLITGKVAKELGLSLILVDQINRVQFKFLMEIMQSGSMSGVSHIYLGKFTKNKKYGTSKRDIPRVQESNL